MTTISVSAVMLLVLALDDNKDGSVFILSVTGVLVSVDNDGETTKK